jgi:hypothetical protein
VPFIIDVVTSKEFEMKKTVLIVGAALILFATFALTPIQRAQGTRIEMQMAYHQKDAPTHIKSVTNGSEFLFESAQVVNDSNKVIRSVTFGVLLHDMGPDPNKTVLLSSREISTNIMAGESRSLEILDLPISKARQEAARLKSGRALAEFGILAVQFDDGSLWNFDWQGEGGAFSSVGVLAAQSMLNGKLAIVNCGPSHTAIQEALIKLIPSIEPVFASTYVCTNSLQELCTNYGNSCTNTDCGKGKDCANQKCQLQP